MVGLKLQTRGVWVKVSVISRFAAMQVFSLAASGLRLNKTWFRGLTGGEIQQLADNMVLSFWYGRGSFCHAP
jgi:hypothetical protein